MATLNGSIEKNVIEVDGSEIIDYKWLTASEALAACESGAIKLMPPTYVSLLEMQRCRSIDRFYQLIGSREMPRYVPKHVSPQGGIDQHDEVYILYEEDVAYHNEDLRSEGEYHRMAVKGGRYSYINTLEDQVCLSVKSSF